MSNIFLIVYVSSKAAHAQTHLIMCTDSSDPLLVANASSLKSELFACCAIFHTLLRHADFGKLTLLINSLKNRVSECQTVS